MNCGEMMWLMRRFVMVNEWTVKCEHTLALSTSVSMLWLALNIFCASCWGLRRVHTKHLSFTQETKTTNKTHNIHTNLLAKLFPALKEVMWGHLSWLEELVDGDGQLEGQVLQSSSISEQHTHTLQVYTSVCMFLPVGPLGHMFLTLFQWQLQSQLPIVFLCTF